MSQIHVGARIRHWREVWGMTITALAEKAGISKSYLHSIENGHTANPSFDTVMRLAWALDVDPRTLWIPQGSDALNSQPAWDRRMFNRIGRTIAREALEAALAKLDEHNVEPGGLSDD